MHRIFSLDVPDIRSKASIVTGKKPLLKADKMNVKVQKYGPGTLVCHDQYPAMMSSMTPFSPNQRYASMQ
jgi:hypothetical protein